MRGWMLTPLFTPLCLEWLQWASTMGSDILAKCSKHCPEKLWPNQSVPVPEGAGPSLWWERMLLTSSFCDSFFPPSALSLLLLKSLGNFPQTLILLILSHGSPWYVFYLLF